MEFKILIWVPFGTSWTKLMHELLKKFPDIALHPDFQKNEPEFYSDLLYHIGYDKTYMNLKELLKFVDVTDNVEIFIDKIPGFKDSIDTTIIKFVDVNKPDPPQSEEAEQPE